MRKRLIIELDEEELRSIMGAVMKTSANFTVETIEPDPKPVRHIQRKTDDGKSASDVVLDFVAGAKRNVHLEEIGRLAEISGFNANSLKGAAKRLVKTGIFKLDGNHVRAA